MSRTCNCGNVIPARISFNGLYKKVSRRRSKCFHCSPFMSTKKINLTPKIVRDRERWKRCRKNRRLEIKLKCIEHKGGECLNCGYKKCIQALEFHHLNPETKSFELGGISNIGMWSEILNELSKCILLCSNCHREVESGLISTDTLVEKENSR